LISQHGGRIIKHRVVERVTGARRPDQLRGRQRRRGSLTQSLAKEVARIGITGQRHLSGLYRNRNAGRKWMTRRDSARVAQIPMRRFGKPEEVAVAVRFLACAEAAYITGSVLKIDGGIF